MLPDLIEGTTLYTTVADDPKQDAEIGDLRGFLKNRVARTDPVLEIGPSYMPQFPKSEGWNVRSIDHLDQGGLVAKYAAMGVDTSRIEPVDHVWTGERLPALVGAERFRCVYASHVVEHATNFVGFLSDCAELLREDGAICLVVPDRRYCFDYLQPPTDTAKVVADALRGAERHSLESLYREESQVAAQYGTQRLVAWWQGPITDLHLMRDDPADRLARLRAAAAGGDYLDAHEYFFTPASFRLIIEELNLLGLLSLRLSLLTRSRGCEFLAVLTGRGAKPMALPDFLAFRKQAALLAIQEQMEVYGKLLSAALPLSQSLSPQPG